MPHVRTTDNSQSTCTEYGEFDVIVSGETVTSGPQPNDYCQACGAVEPTWEVISDEDFLERFPL